MHRKPECISISKSQAACRPRFRGCIIADAAHADSAAKLGVPMKKIDALKKLNTNKKWVKKPVQ